MLRALVGPTASGKTEAGIALAERLGAEVVSVDSMLVYRGMDVGTAKPTPAERARIPHHLLDVADPSERFTVARYQTLASEALPRIERPLLVGGSGLYFRAIVDDLVFPPEDPEVRGALETELAVLGAARLHDRLAAADPVAAGRIEPPNARRTVRALEVAAVTGRPFSDFAEPWGRYDAARVRAAGIRLDREALALRAETRVRAMLDAGWLGEVAGLVARGFGAWLTASQAIGYAELAEHLAGRLPLETAIDRTIRRTRELGRRQSTWFARDPRIRWFDAGAGGAAEVLDEVGAYLEAG
ncbi:MAG TPA: tRNA (adenosine(37)-N6)-dimethylallyltransferase MiaA [Actinomycetota bacterium]|nr:tRNA (adenosine(37)-N6)-dimethylallyltransferase MiaA [Actinomycetota bacterium]